jgi:hypothetical protein
MSTFNWAILASIVSLLIAMRGIVVAQIARGFFEIWIRSSATARFFALALAIAAVSAFPPLRQSGDWREKETAQPPSVFVSYRLDKRWFGVLPFYQFSGEKSPSQRVSVEYRPWSHLPVYKMTRKTCTIDYPILIAEALFMISCIVFANRFHKSANQLRPLTINPPEEDRPPNNKGYPDGSPLQSRRASPTTR